MPPQFFFQLLQFIFILDGAGRTQLTDAIVDLGQFLGQAQKCAVSFHLPFRLLQFRTHRQISRLRLAADADVPQILRSVPRPSLHLYFLLKRKAMTQVTLSQKNQIVVPREARQALGAKAGDKLLVVVRGPAVIILQKPAAHQPAIRGIGRGVYKADYLHAERQSWD